MNEPPSRWSRRRFLTASAAGVGGALAGARARSTTAAAPQEEAPEGPVSIASGNGLPAVRRASELLQAGEDPLEAVVSGVGIVEDDPEDMGVGLGGLPNEDGIVELDASVMHGPSGKGGAVAALRGFRHPARVAQRVMSRTDHVLIVGEGAARFARAHGFEEEDLLTDAARERWLRWKEGLSGRDDWLTEEEATDAMEARPAGTINCLGIDGAGGLAGVTTTSGLAYKIPGRVGDSPIIGAGLYVDNEAGAAGATGRGEAVILSGGSRVVCENLRRGLHPRDAVMDVLRRIAARTTEPRLLDEDGRPTFQVTFYALRKDGAYASGCLWGGKTFAVADGRGVRQEDCIALYERTG